MIAAREGHVQALTALLAARPKVNIRNSLGETALMLAALNGRAPVVKQLLARGAQVNHEGWTPLMYAATGGHAEVSRLLIVGGADVNAVAENGVTALMMAANGLRNS